jgi:hypothetical protein
MPKYRIEIEENGTMKLYRCYEKVSTFFSPGTISDDWHHVWNLGNSTAEALMNIITDLDKRFNDRKE